MDSTMILSHKWKNFSSPTKRAIDHNYITKSLVYENIWFLWFSTPCTIKNMIELRENSTKWHFEKMIDDSHTNVWFWRKWLFFCCSFWN
jgi:hypothetical protein